MNTKMSTKTIIENKTYFLRENVTGAENRGCRFECSFGTETAQFSFDVEDAEIVSPFCEDNEDIWQGDAVEVFLSPDGNPMRYLEMEVSPFGVSFFGEISFVGETRSLKKLPPPFSAETVRSEEGYSVRICLPLSGLESFDRDKMKLNAFRLDKCGDGEQKLYALSPTYCNTFHKPQYFLSVNKK